MRFSLKRMIALVCIAGIALTCDASAQAADRVVIQTSTILDGKGAVLARKKPPTICAA